MRVVSADESRALDVRTIAAGTPGIVLMKRAANAAVREIAGVLGRRPSLAARVVVLAGPGNNGGDGFEVARLLMAGRLASSVETILLGNPLHLTPDARKTYHRLEQVGGAIREVNDARELEPLAVATLVVDALFGTGLKRRVAPDGLPARAIALASSGPAFVVSIDLPSGLSADEADAWVPSVRADLTVTFGWPKPCHVERRPAARCGRIAVADLGFVEPAEPAVREAVAVRDVAALFPRRAAESHKGTYGRLLVVGGSRGMAGAPALACRAAHRAGAGLVTAAVPDDVRAILHMLTPETTSVGGDADFARYSAIAVGPGWGEGSTARETLARAVAEPVPAVFDADALNLAGGAAFFAGRRVPTVLTPHPGEAGRLLGIPVEDVNADREAAAVRIARAADAVVVLKGFRPIVADPSGRAAPVLAGNAALASGGTGDVLTGVVGALLARGLSAWDAACAAAWLHGTAGDLLREAKGEESVTASDVVEALPDAFLLAREAAGG
ncbi:MAG: NAD(P)H-hydrate dehydratase [Acidobacteria bacterium]|nr:NAD(P)H-hydrate dehydratase [Acidobacteriota bacterium]